MSSLVNIIMPVYNAEKYIAKSIQSVLEQTYTDFELILIDDCPTDKTMDIVNCFHDDRLILLHNERNMGISYSRNRGLKHCCGKYIALLDNDDISLPERLEKEVGFLEKNSAIDIVAGSAEFIDEADKVVLSPLVAMCNPSYVKASLLFWNRIINSSVMFRKSIIDNYGFHYKDNKLGMEDFLFWIECSKLVKISGIHDIVVQYRIRQDNESNKMKNQSAEKRAALFSEFQRYSLWESGFRLSEEYLSCINKVLAEDLRSASSKRDLESLYGALAEVIRQAKVMNCDNYKEIVFFCKKIFSEKLYKMENMFAEVRQK